LLRELEVRLGALKGPGGRQAFERVRRLLIHLGERRQPDAVRALFGLVDHRDRQVRESVDMILWWALPSLRERTEEVMPELLEAVKHRNPEIRATAAHSLGHVVKRKRQAEAALRVALRDRNADVREAAANALARLKPAGR